MGPTKTYLVTLLVVDHDDLGEGETRGVIEHTKYPNYCIHPRVLEMRTQEVLWTDDHPLNGSGWEKAAKDLFAEESTWQPMDTAPKNTWVLMTCGYFVYKAERAKDKYVEAGGMEIEPIAWMPLPKPPQ